MAKKMYFQVLGTKCASCEIVLERELKTLPGVERVEASHDAGRIALTVKDGVALLPADLEKKVGGHGYRFAGIDAPEESFSWGRLLGAAGLVALVYLVLQRTGVLTFAPDVDAAAGYGAIFVVGLVAAFSSCTAVVGGLVAAMSARHAQRHAGESLAKKMRPHALFNVGRLVGFAGFGAAVGALGRAVELSPAANGVLVVVIALIMLALGVQLMGIMPRGRFSVRPPKWLAHKIHDLSESDNPWVPAVVGALTFFLPCGFTQSMQVFALASGDPIQAATIMTVFALGTAPALLGIGVATSAVRGEGLRLVTKAVGAMVVALGIANVANGATLLGFTGFTAAGDDVVAAQVLVDGKQVVQMEVTPYGAYSPSTLRVTEDVPARWEIFGANSMGCASTLVMPTFGIQKRLKPGENVIEFTPTKSGTFSFSCSMGMVRGTMIVEPRS